MFYHKLLSVSQVICGFFVLNDNRFDSNRDYPWEMYTLKELLRATNNFHHDNKIGEGGFGSVYFGRTIEGIEVCV